MFKYVIVILALIAATFASPQPKPQYFYPSSYAYSSQYAARPAATVYSAGFIPTAYSSSYVAPAPYSAAAYPTYAYL